MLKNIRAREGASYRVTQTFRFGAKVAFGLIRALTLVENSMRVSVGADLASVTEHKIQNDPNIEPSGDMRADAFMSIRVTPSMLMHPTYLEPSAWIEHVPFAFWLVGAHRPNSIVELGSHYGTFYFAFCQAVNRLGLGTRCYAVDSWVGGEQAGFSGDEVFEKAKAHNDALYSGFSTLLRSSFGESLRHFNDGRVDLLHIGGLHALEAVESDFRTWFPKLSERGVVVFHHSNMRERNSGLFQLIESVRAEYPSFEFNHGHGLVIVGVGKNQSPELDTLFRASASEADEIRTLFSYLGNACANALIARHPEDQVQLLRAQVERAERNSASLEMALDGMRREVLERQRGLEQALDEHRQLRGLLDRHMQTIGETRQQLDLARMDHEDNVRKITELEAAKLKEVTGLRDARAADLAELAAARDRFRSAEHVIEAQHQELSALRDNLAAFHKERDGALEVSKQSQHEVSRITRSSSWRMTAPMRGATRSLREANRSIQRTMKRPAMRKAWFAATLQVGRLTKEMHLGRLTKLVKKSALFDANWYLSQYPDVREQGVDPLYHFLVWGGLEERDPHPSFNTSYYLARNPDVRAAGINPLVHYLTNGIQENRAPNPSLDEYYFAAFDASLQGANHAGAQLAGRKFLDPEFDASWYFDRYSDARASGLDAHEHYLRVGYLDGRSSSARVAERSSVGAHHLHFPKTDSPEVSVIVPVYKNFTDTLRCLYSIASDTSTRTKYEIIVADDCPIDPTEPHLAGASGLKILANEVNLGFVRNCNAAAKHAKGEFILFLNNDTVVCPGWLDSLVEAARRDPRIAMVGSKLLNADGTIQEAGGIIFRDGWGYSYGRGDDPRRAQYNYVRDVDVVTGACFLVRRNLFETVGSLPDEFAPAFYEEFDLAFSFAHHGYRVVYQPKSEVYHLGSQSYGAETRDAQSGVNHAKFVKRWSERLVRQVADKRNLFVARERKKARGTILVIDDFVPEYDKHAGALTVFQYISMLVDEGFKVIFVPDHKIELQPYTSTFQQMGVEVLHQPFDFEGWLSDAGRWIDWVWIARPNIAATYLDVIRSHSRARLIYYTHDLHFLREMRRYEVSGDRRALKEAERFRAMEMDIFRQVDCVTTPSTVEGDIILENVPTANVQVLPAYFFKPKAVPVAENLQDRREIIFVGGYRHAPNVDAAKILVDEVMPLVWREIPDVRVILVGSHPTREIHELAGPRVEVTGHVPSLEPYFMRARLSLSPLRYGAGVKGKIVSSLEAGVPVVTTPIGNEGINLENGVEALIGETPRELADHVIRLFREPDLLRALAEQGLLVVNGRFSEDKAREAFFAALKIADSDFKRRGG